MTRVSARAMNAARVLDKVASQQYDMPLAEVDACGETIDMRRIYRERKVCPKCKRSSA